MSLLSRLACQVTEWLGEPPPSSGDSGNPVAFLTSRPVEASPKVRITGIRVVSAVPRTERAVAVQRTPLPYWQERGWVKQGDEYRGRFKTSHGEWSGLVTFSPSGRVDVHILNPPSALEKHPHWPCFRSRGRGWYWVHPISIISDISAGILNLEKTLDEAYAI